MADNLISHARDVDLTRFSGGEARGTCIQISTPMCEDSKNTPDSLFRKDIIQLTKAQAAALAADLLDFAQNRETIDWREEDNAEINAEIKSKKINWRETK
jgi:hypothetical protein